MIAYLDTSIFLRRLLPSPERLQAIQLCLEIQRRVGFLPLTDFGKFEVIQALRFEEWRHRNDRTKGLSGDQADHAMNLFLAEVGSTFQIISFDWKTAIREAERMTRSTPDNGWRTADLLQVAIAVACGCAEFYSFDQKQNTLAALQHLKTPLQKNILT